MPAARPLSVVPVPPDDHADEYCGVPPEIVTLTDPLLVPQVAGVAEVSRLRAAGSVMETLAVAVHPLLSVTVTV